MSSQKGGKERILRFCIHFTPEELAVLERRCEDRARGSLRRDLYQKIFRDGLAMPSKKALLALFALCSSSEPIPGLEDGDRAELREYCRRGLEATGEVRHD